MSDAEHVRRFDGPDELAAAAAERVLQILADAQEIRGAASVVLTGGSISRKIHSALAADAERLDWSEVDVFWGDDRFVASQDPDRNAAQAREDLLDRVAVSPGRVHEMAASDTVVDVDAGASAYADELQRYIGSRGVGDPWFDVLMLGIGPDGHCASLFPGRPEVSSEAYVLPVTGSPKPPPVRISLGMPVLGRARHVVFAATGDEKADAVARSVAGGNVVETPAAGPRGLESTTWYVDTPAASKLPPSR